MSAAGRLRAMIALAVLIFSSESAFGGGSGLTAGDPANDRVTENTRTSPAVIPAQPFEGLASYRFEPTGLSLLHPYASGKIPVVLIHGLWSSPRSWTRMLEVVDEDPAIRERYQFWVFGYSTGQPILYSAHLLRQAIMDARRRYDPDGTDPSFGRMVLIGYSMGGLLAKVMAQDSQFRLWQTISAEPPDRLMGPPEARQILHQSFLFKPLTEVERLVLIATPHRGSRLDQGVVSKLASRFVKLADPLQTAYQAILTSNRPDFFLSSFRLGLPTSVDQLEWNHPLLLDLDNLGIDPAVKFHSIIPDLSDPPRKGGSDGVVPYASAHVDGSVSELVVHGSHVCQDNPQIIEECRRILIDHGYATPGSLVPDFGSRGDSRRLDRSATR